MLNGGTSMHSSQTPIDYLFIMLSPPSERMLKWMWKVCAEVSISKTDVELVYVFDSIPSGAHGKPTKDEIRDCYSRLKDRVNRVQPKVIITFGSETTEFCSGLKENIHDSRGYLITKDRRVPLIYEEWREFAKYKMGNKARGIKAGDPRFKWMKVEGNPILPDGYEGILIPTFSLDHIRTDAFVLTPAFKADLDRAFRVVHEQLEVIDDQFKFFDNLSGDARSDYFYGDILALDIETPRDSPIVERISISDGNRTHTLAWTLDVRKWIQRQIDFAVERDAYLIFHNGSFDIPRLEQAGITFPDSFKWIDTMLLAVLLQPDLRKGLGAVASVYLDTYAWKWESYALKDPLFYSAKDAFVTARLARKLISLCQELGMWNLFVGGGNHPGPGLMAVIRELMDVTTKGIKLDKEATQKWYDELSEKSLRYLQEWNSKHPGVNPNSTKDLQKLLYKDWELPPQYTKSDGLSTNELALIKLREMLREEPNDKASIDDINLLLNIRAVQKNMSTYAKPALANVEGRVYPSYLPEAKDREIREGTPRKGNTSTGRLAASYPNIANQPKVARIMYVPDTPNDCFIQGDWKSAELVVAAYLSGDTVLQDDLKHDIHQRNAERLKIDRDTGKNVIYAKQYFAGPPKLSDMILAQTHKYISPTEIAEIVKGFNRIYWRLESYKQWVISQLIAKGYVTNPFGRIKFSHAHDAPSAYDFIMQSTVADILLCVLCAIASMARSLGGRLILTVYDSILIQVPIEKQDEGIKGLREIMERSFDNIAPGFKIPVEIEIGEAGASWGNLRKLK